MAAVRQLQQLREVLEEPALQQQQQKPARAVAQARVEGAAATSSPPPAPATPEPPPPPPPRKSDAERLTEHKQLQRQVEAQAMESLFALLRAAEESDTPAQPAPAAEAQAKSASESERAAEDEVSKLQRAEKAVTRVLATLEAAEVEAVGAPMQTSAQSD